MMNQSEMSALIEREADVPALSINSLREAGARIVAALLADSSGPLALLEASVHRGSRSKIWVASFTDCRGRQVWRSTRQVDREKALALARRWAAQAARERSRLAQDTGKPRPRHGRRAALLTQKEVGLIMNLSERTIRGIERSAFRKLLSHPDLIEVWRQWKGLQEMTAEPLTTAEIQALFDLVVTDEEMAVIEKVLSIIQP